MLLIQFVVIFVNHLFLAFLSMVMPSLLSIILKRVNFSVTIIAWLIGVIFMAFTIYIGNCYNSISFFIFASFYLLFLSHESYRRRIEIETKSKRENLLLAEKNERQELENSAKELRHMIGNVAHDLKTVNSFYVFRHSVKLLNCSL